MRKKEIVAIIPARGNSKSISKKNIREFAGYPLIAYSITAALRSKYVTRVIVSTDNAEIASVARKFGAQTPFMRPDVLALDNTTDFPVFEHALIWLEENGNYKPDLVVQLRPTSPIFPKNLIDDAIEVMLKNSAADSVRGVVLSGQNPYKMWHIARDGELKSLLQVEGLGEPFNSPRQALPATYWQTGHIDVIRRDTILKMKSMSGNKIYPVMIDPAYSVDIDTLLDWKRGERLVREGLLDMVYPGDNPRPFPESVELLVLDFDGVLTDDRVYVNQDGVEAVAASRSDGLGLELLREKTDIDVVVMSKEKNPVVAARCKKLKIPVFQSVDNKRVALEKLLNDKNLDPAQVMFVGNDINDVPCFPYVGYSAVPCDAFPIAKQQADMVLKQAGGFGAVREVCELLLEKFPKGG